MTYIGKIIVGFVLTLTFISSNQILASGEFLKDSEWKFVEDKRKLGDKEEVIYFKSQEEKEVKLSEDQIKELEKITLDLISTKKELIDKYAEFGILSEEKAVSIKNHLDRHFEKMKQEQFVPKWDKHWKKRKNQSGSE